MTIVLIIPDPSTLPHNPADPLASATAPQSWRRRPTCRRGALHIPSLLVGIGLFVVLGVAFGFVAQSALRPGGPGEFDKKWALRFKRIADMNPDNTPWINAMTHLGSRYALAALALCGSLWQVWRGRRWLAVAWIVIAAGGGILSETAKHLGGRERPLELRDPIVAENLVSKSFPSGHAMGSMIGFGLVGYAMMLQAKKLMQYVLPLVDLPIIVFAIGFSRAYLRVHWATDVLGGFLLGAAWLALSLGFVEAWRRGQGIQAHPAAPAKTQVK